MTNLITYKSGYSRVNTENWDNGLRQGFHGNHMASSFYIRKLAKQLGFLDIPCHG